LVIGGVTFTGSIVAFGKLQGFMSSKPLLLPGRNAINLGLLAANIGTFGVFMATQNPQVGLSCLGLSALLSFIKGYHLTAAIGGAGIFFCSV
jgi:NAD(P) transhydrogenase